MVFDHLTHSAIYSHLGSAFEKAFYYLQNFDPATPTGRIEIESDRIVALIQEYESKPAEGKLFESHRRRLDIQYIVSGREAIYHAPVTELVVDTPFDETKDYALYTGRNDMALQLKEGNFAIFWPQDGHKPGCVWESTCAVKKVVIKIDLSH